MNRLPFLILLFWFANPIPGVAFIADQLAQDAAYDRCVADAGPQRDWGCEE